MLSDMPDFAATVTGHVAPRPRYAGLVAPMRGVEPGPPAERPDPHLAEQVVGGLPAGPAGQVGVHGDLMAPDDLDERVGAPARRPLDQDAVRFHPSP
jgi:hypothetical protein